jgi:O-antigen/teichoic acid export membrane protein
MGRALLIVVQFVSHVVLARSLGSSGYGVLSLAIPIVVLSAFVARAGIPRTLQKYIPTYVISKNTAELAGLVQWSMRWTLVLALVISAALFIAAPGLQEFVFKYQHFKITLVITAMSILFINVVRWLGAFGLSIGKVRLDVLGQHVVQPLTFLLFLLVALNWRDGQLDPVFAAATYAASWSLTAVLMWQQSKPIRESLPVAVPSRVDADKWAGFSMRATLPEIAERTRFWIDLIVAGTLLTSGSLGVLAVCLRIAYMPSNILAAFGSIFLHRISELYANGDLDELDRQYASVTFSVLSISLPSVALLILLGPWILSVFGDEFGAGYATLLIILVAQTIVAALGPCWPVMLLTGSENRLLMYSIGSIILSIILCVLLIPTLGILGAGIANAASLSVLSIWQVLHIHRLHKINPFRKWQLRLLPPIVAAILAELIRREFWPVSNEILAALVTVLTFGFVYFAVSVWAGAWKVALVGDVLRARKKRKASD